VTAPGGDITIAAKKVDIVEARETSQTTVEQKFKQSGLTLEVVSPVLSALQTAQQMSEAAGNTSDGRMKGLAAANVAFAAKKAADAIQKGQLPKPTGGNNPSANTDVEPTAAEKAGGIDLAISIGGSESQSRQDSQSDTARGSSVTAAGDVNIQAVGAGQDSNLTIRGSVVEAGRNVQLQADNEIKLQAAKNIATQNSTNSSSSASVGISYGTSGLMFNASGGKGSGKSDGNDTSYTNTEIKGRDQVNITSGGNTTLQGALIKADQIKATVGGDLEIKSPQDTSTYTSEQKNASASVSIGYGNGSASVSASKSNINSDFKSVGEQSGLKAGDAGFQVNVQGNTDLKGGVIASTEKAVQESKNSFSTGGTLTTTDLQNTASYEGKASGFSLGGGPVADMKGITGLGIGLGSDKKDASSTTTSGISGIAGDAAKRTGDAETGLKPIFDADKVQREINAQVLITQAFTRDAGKAVGDFAQGKLNDAKALRNQAAAQPDPESAAALRAQAQDLEDTWGDGKFGRVLLHTLVGGLAGGVSGAAGAATSASAAPLMDELQFNIELGLQSAGMSAAVAKGIAQSVATLTAAGAGAVVGGAQGAATAATVDANNRQLHAIERSLAQKLALASRGKYTVKQIEDAMRNSGNKAFGEDVNANTIIKNLNDPNATFDKGAVFDKDADKGLAIVQVPPNKGIVDPALAAFILANTGGSASPYKWDIETNTPATASNGQKPFQHSLVSANGQTFSLPVADCPAVSCTNGSPIAWASSDPQDQAAIAAYKEALDKQNAKAAVVGGLTVATAGALPATLVGTTVAGAIVGGGSSAAGQAIDGKDIDGKEVLIDTAKGAAFGAAGYGVVKSLGVADDLLIGASAEAKSLAAAEAKAIETTKLENNIGRDDGDLYQRYKKPDGSWDWPANMGAVPGTEKIVTLPPGRLVDRLGEDTGRFVSPQGVPFIERSLAPGSGAALSPAASTPYRRYEVLKPLPNAIEAEVALAFGQPGGGTQILLEKPISWYVTNQYLKEIK
jgi:hypothetical protein